MALKLTAAHLDILRAMQDGQTLKLYAVASHAYWLIPSMTPVDAGLVFQLEDAKYLDFGESGLLGISGTYSLTSKGKEALGTPKD